MKRTIVFLVSCFLLLTSYCPALAFYPAGVNPGQRKLSYLFMPDQLNPSEPTSSIIFQQGADEKLGFELSVVGYRSSYIITNYTYQLGLHSSYKFFDAGGLRLTGVSGLGGLYAGNIGFSLAVDLGVNASAGPVSVSMLPSIFSDGVLLAYGLSINLGIPFLSDKEIILGGRGNATIVSSGGAQAFSNRLYGIVGVRTSL